MSNATETLKKVRSVLGLEVKMEQLKMENGTVIEADKFEAGEAVFIVTEDEKVALPVGSYELEDNKMLVVEEEGIIAKLDEHEEVEEEVKEEEAEEKAEELEYVSREEFGKAMDEIKAMIEEVKNMDHGKKEMSEEITEEVSEEVSEEQELKEELSKPAVQPFKHSPEKTAEREVVRFSQNKRKSILDTVFEKLNQ